MDFNFECIGEKLTDDEEKIGKLKAWGWKMSFTWRKTKLHVLTLSPHPPPILKFFEKCYDFRKEKQHNWCHYVDDFISFYVCFIYIDCLLYSLQDANVWWCSQKMNWKQNWNVLTACTDQW